MMSEWISVKDKLPELEQYVLLFDYWKSSEGKEYKDMRVGYLDEYTTRKTSEGLTHSLEWKGTEFAFNITHWMPLPQPPITPTK
jgi:hypothetical protein